MKKIISMLLIVSCILSFYSLSFAAESTSIVSNITFTGSLDAGNMTAKLDYVNISERAATPTLVVSSIYNGRLNGIWYNKAEK